MNEMYYLTPLRASETIDSEEPVWIQLAPYGTWKPYGNDLSVTPEMAQRMVENFNNNIRGHEIGLDYEHGLKDTKASGWLRRVEARTDGVWGLVDWTRQAREQIRNKEWKYFSLDWHPAWPHPTTGVVYNDVIFGGGLTNRPQHKGRLPINASELLLETDMDGDTDTKGQKPDDFNPDSPLEPDYAQPRKGGHKEPGTAPDNPSPTHPADDDPSNKSDDTLMDRMKAWFTKNVDEVENTHEEGDVVKLDDLRKRLGLDADADEDAILAAIDSMKEEVEPLRKVAAEVEGRNKFASEYPDQHARLVALEQTDRKTRASEFAAQFKDIGEGKMLSTEARSKIEGAYLAIENHSLTASEFGEALAAATDRGNVVDMVEHGSSQASELTDPNADTFAAKIKEIQNEDNLDYRSAVKLASERHPELAEAYVKQFAKGGE